MGAGNQKITTPGKLFLKAKTISTVLNLHTLIPRLFQNARMEDLDQGFEPIHQAGAGAAGKVVIKSEHLSILDRGQHFPPGTRADFFWGFTPGGIAQQDESRVSDEELLDADGSPLALQACTNVLPPGAYDQQVNERAQPGSKGSSGIAGIQLVKDRWSIVDRRDGSIHRGDPRWQVTGPIPQIQPHDR